MKSYNKENMRFLERIKQDKWIIVLLIVAAALRFYRLGFQSAWIDELHTLKESDPMLTFSEFHQVIMFREGIPHFYFIILRWLEFAFGSNIVVVRSLSAVAGIASVYFIYLLGKALWSKPAGLIAAALLTFNLFHIEYSQEGRSYALMLCFTVLAFYYTVRLVQDMNLKNAILSGLFTGLITNTQPIALVNVITIYLLLLIVLIVSKAQERKKVFKYSFISGMTALVVFIPVYQIVMKVSEIKSMWIPAPTLDSVASVFVKLSGHSRIMACLTVIAAAVIFALIVMRRRQHKGLLENRLLFAFVVLSMWILVESGIIITKSILGESIVLGRYFIGLVPALCLCLAIAIDQLNAKIAKITITAALCMVMGYRLVALDYYNTRTKSQFDVVCAHVMQNNFRNDKVVSNWEWLLSYYLNRDGKGKHSIENKLEVYAEDLKNDAIDRGSFWYIDGNSRPYNLSPELDKYLQENYVIEKFEAYDAWAYHFKYKKETTNADTTLDLTEFAPSNFDGNGRLIFFENATYTYPPIPLENGKYKLIINGFSQPEKPIDHQNAHINVSIDGVKVSSFYLSENTGETENEIHFKVLRPKNVILRVNFDNDFSNDLGDRNAVISKMKIVKE
jgi:hypothetical protein